MPTLSKGIVAAQPCPRGAARASDKERKNQYRYWIKEKSNKTENLSDVCDMSLRLSARANASVPPVNLHNLLFMIILLLFLGLSP